MNIKNVSKHFKTWGVTKGLYFCVMAALSPWLTLCHIHLRQQNSKTFKLPEGVEIRLLSVEELISHCEDPDLELDLDMVKDAYARGDSCFAAFLNGEIIAYVWRATSNTPHTDGLWVSFKQGLRYEYKEFTRENFRRQHLHSALSQYTDKIFIEKGFDKGIAFIESHNFPSLLSRNSWGSKKVGYAGYLTLFGKTFCFRSPSVKRLGFEFYLPQEQELEFVSN